MINNGSNLVSVKIIKDSINNGNRLTTFELEYPRYIHSELLTHRVFSRNAQSSRAIPVDKAIRLVEKSNWYPIFMYNKPGMSPIKELSSYDLEETRKLWNTAKREAIRSARYLKDLNVHKQIVNRLLEPFSKIKVILTATDFDNFFSLRIHEAAQQEIQLLAMAMKKELDLSAPTELEIGEWHLPYIREDEEDYSTNLKVKLSTARCARVSYLNHDGLRDIDKDVTLHNDLFNDRHLSPFEHVATPSSDNVYNANFKGWYQYRMYLEKGWKFK